MMPSPVINLKPSPRQQQLIDEPAGSPSSASRHAPARTTGRPRYYRAISEARVGAPADALQRARAAVVTVHRSAVTVTQEAIRVCGGRAMLKRYPLERYARDARAAALMRPWTQEIATQQAGETALEMDAARG